MSAITFFYQECPICGRSLRVSIKHFGRQMCCTHCHGEFRAGKDELPKRVAEPGAAVSPSLAITPGMTPQLGEA